MVCYVGIGGIGCRTIKDLCKKTEIDEKFCFYIDTDVGISEIESKNKYIVEGLEYGSSVCRNIGRSFIKKVLYSRKMDAFFEEIMSNKPDEIYFVLSSFGGFGSAIATEIIEYLTVNYTGLIFNYEVIAFNEKFMC
ncbi:MAG: hypothetical protein K6G88_07010 [Lachnospiraceae bacterium]|nr:hypothetical protein [Lachnospiraceae bacterium]